MSEISKYSCQDIDQNDSLAVLEVLNSDFLTQGPKVAEFEAAVNGTRSRNFRCLITVQPQHCMLLV